MQLSIVLSAATTKRLALLGVTATLLLVGTTAYAEFTQFKPTEKLTAEQLNASFTTLQTGIADSRVAAVGTKKFSLGATYRKPTDAVPGGFQSGGNGYASAKSRCEVQLASETAHMCTGEELTRSRQLGIEVSSGWYTSGAYFFDGPNSAASHECSGWTSSAGGKLAPRWDAEGEHGPSIGSCSDSHPILCCD
jgi:hypothetical protein